MAIIKCPDCGLNVSDRAQACPRCGFPIQEEVQKLESNANSTDELDTAYTELSELDIAKKYVDAATNNDFSSMNKARRTLEKKYAAGKYCAILKEAISFSDDENEREVFILKNFQLLTDYLDYPMLEIGYRDWIDLDAEGKKYKGFFQTSPATYEDFTNYYVVENVYSIVSLLDDNWFCDILSHRFSFSSGYGYAIFLKENIEFWNVLLEKNGNFYDSKEGSIHVKKAGLTDIIHKGDLVWLASEEIEKTVIDQAAVDKQLIHAAAQMLSLAPDVYSSPMKASTSAIVGTALAGLPGALIGYAIGNERNNKYAKAVERSKQVEKEREEALKTIEELKRGNKPTKQVTITRNYYGIRTFAGVYPIYFDDEKIADESISIDGESLTYYTGIKIKIGDKYVKFRNVQANIYLLRGELIDEEYAMGIFSRGEEITLNDTNESIRKRYYELSKQSISDIEDSKSVDELESIIEFYKKFEDIEDVSKEIEKCKEEICEIEYKEAVDALKNAKTINDYEDTIKLFNRHSEYRDTADRIQECKESICEVRYDAANNWLHDNDIDLLEKAVSNYEMLQGWRDANQKKEECLNKIQKIKSKENNKKKIIQIICFSIPIILVVTCILFFFFIIPAKNRNRINKLYAEGKYLEAIDEIENLKQNKGYDQIVEQCKTAYIDACIDNKKYLDAIHFIYSNDGDIELINNIRLMFIKDLYAEHEYEQAINQLGLCNPSDELKELNNIVKKEYARECYENHLYSKVIVLLSVYDDKESIGMLNECYYNLALPALGEGNQHSLKRASEYLMKMTEPINDSDKLLDVVNFYKDYEGYWKAERMIWRSRKKSFSMDSTSDLSSFQTGDLKFYINPKDLSYVEVGDWPIVCNQVDYGSMKIETGARIIVVDLGDWTRTIDLQACSGIYEKVGEDSYYDIYYAIKEGFQKN